MSKGAGVSEGAALKKANINYTTTKKGGKTTYHVNKNDEADAQAAMKNDPKYIVGKTRVQSEAKVEKNRSDFGKASVRNKRKFGSEGEPLVGKAAIFRQKGDRGDLIDQRRAEHKARRGVKTKGVSEDIVNEISSRTLSNYIKKGTQDVAKRASDPDSHSGPKYGKKMNRMDGVMKAADKLAKKAGKNEEVIPEAKVDVGKSPEGKEAARNKRKFGTSHNQAKTGALRRSLHKIRRGDKKIKGEKPYYGDGGYAAEGKEKGLDGKACWKGYSQRGTKQKGGKTVDNCVKNEGAILDIVRKGMGKHKDAIQKRKVASRKATPYAAMAQSYEPEGNMIPEEGYDRMRDDRLVKYGIGHDGSDRRSGSTPSRSSGTKSKGKTVFQKQAEKKYGKGVTALDIVKAKIKAKHGDGAIMDKKK
tara:strand:- start:27 stop:1277 length:1251 start_codon:yes stop_codon:yes gene_type:complete